ncbi:MAG: bifunctional transaldolase/phosoglucose isomerase [Saprospiraceae bacterium]
MNPLIELLENGQSYWLDNLTREKITSGELKKRVEEQGLRGITSNPSIFNKAITGGSDYDDQIGTLVKEGKNPSEIYDALTIKDVQDACDILYPVYEQSNGADGFVSLEVPPYLARDTEGTIREVRRLSIAVGKQNCQIKIPGTKEGIPAIEQMLYEGININITLLFSVDRYIEVANAYIRALQRRLAEGKTINEIISVASVFISRIDVLTDQLLDQYTIPTVENKNTNPIQLLSGRAGIVTARLCYQQFKKIFGDENWKKLEKQGAHVQRPLWASTSNKDPLFDDLRYVEALIGDNTVNTLPDATISAFASHGTIKKDAIEQDIEQSNELYGELKRIGIDISFVTQQLENEGIQKFIESYNELISNLADKRMKLLGGEASPQQISCGKLEAEVKSAYTSMDEKQIARLLFAMDPHLWKNETEEVKSISERMGWLNLPDHFIKHADDIITFAQSIKEEAYKDILVLGMGGSSLCSEVTRQTYDRVEGYPQLWVLDNTEPAAILAIEGKIDLDKTLFIVATKSGNTEETLSFFRYFHQQLVSKKVANPGDNFVAITDHGTSLVKLAEEFKFRKVFINPSDHGGRYSVLSNFGLLPMALMGIDIDAVLASAKQMKNSCDGVPTADNPGISLGVVLGICQKNARDKVTFILSSSISSFGLWVEQLLAESTGKEGKGLIPINGEILAGPEAYGNDRIFVHMCLPTDDNEADERKIKALEEAGYPVVRIKVANKIALGGEYFRWEIAAAIAGVIMRINPFDQPNVEESKKNTSQLLEEWGKNGDFKILEPLVKQDNISVYSGKATQQLAGNNKSVGDILSDFAAMASPNDYIALLPYFMMTDHRIEILQSWRNQMRNDLKVATTLLNGPRYLHSTGQLHKGGPDTGMFIILIADEHKYLAIPREKFGFATLHEAQALGDFNSLDHKGRRVIRINLGKNIDLGLSKLLRRNENLK